jgi:hypothetical protein
MKVLAFFPSGKPEEFEIPATITRPAEAIEFAKKKLAKRAQVNIKTVEVLRWEVEEDFL